MLTATNPDAPAILHWDGLMGHPRNPVSSYVYVNGSPASQWGMKADTYSEVVAVFRAPCHWQEPTKFAHQGEGAYFALEGCRDAGLSSLCLFPEILKAELHGIRAVVEAHSNKTKTTGSEAGNANGLVFTKGTNRGLLIRVKSESGAYVYELDRWD